MIPQLDSARIRDLQGADFLFHQREVLRSTIFKSPPPGPTKGFVLNRELHHGWLLPLLLQIDDFVWGRWSHWADCCMANAIVGEKIPVIQWTQAGDQGYSVGRKMWERSLNAIPSYGEWQGCGSWNSVDYLFNWLLFGFGHQGNKELPKEPSDCVGASARLYQTFCLDIALAFPFDYFGDILAENKHGRHLGFYPTPLNVCEMMAMMLMGDGDCRTQTVSDPCVGTGRMVMAASNHSYRLFAQDINETVIRATLINGYLYAPWLVRPFPFLERPIPSVIVSDALSQQAEARPDVAAYFGDTEHDSEKQPLYEPVKIRRRKKPIHDETLLLELI